RDADGANDESSPPGRTATQEIESHPNEAVKRDLEHDTGHQRRDVTWRDRVGSREPDVKWNQPGFRAKPDQRADEYECPRGRSERMATKAKGDVIESAACRREREQSGEEKGGADVGHDQVDEAGP